MLDGGARPSLQSTVGVNRTYLSKLDKGASYPGLEIIAKPAILLDVGPSELLRLPGVMPDN